MDFHFILLLICFITIWDCLLGESKIFIVLLDGDSVVSYNTKAPDESIIGYKEKVTSGHDIFLESFLQPGSYTKLYSYTHLLNGFAIHVASHEVLNNIRNATGVREIHEDMKMQKLTTHTPDFLGLRAGVWPMFGGANTSGDGVVIGLVDTGINPLHPSFSSRGHFVTRRIKFKGKCATGEQFPSTACNGKIVGAQYFARGAVAAGEFNSHRDYDSPFDGHGHGSHTAATAAGNFQVPVLANGFNYGYASGMAPGARIAAYKALYTFGGYMSDVVAAVDQAVEDGVDILSLSVGPSSIPTGTATVLNVLDLELLFATKAGVLVIQAAGNGGPSSGSVLSYSPWITSVAASITDRKYNNTIQLGNGQSFSGTGLAPPTERKVLFPIAAAADVSRRNATIGAAESCQSPELFILPLVHGKLIMCSYTFDFEYEAASIANVANTMQELGAAGFIITMDPDIGPEQVKGTAINLPVPGIVIDDLQASSALWEYYHANTLRGGNFRDMAFTATARILDGREATYTIEAPVVASYSSRGPDVNTELLQSADVLKPTIMGPGSSIWAAWSPSSTGDRYMKGKNFALVSGTSMATPHIAGVAALIKQKHPNWSPAAITSAMMTTADVYDNVGSPIFAQLTNQLAPATPFDFGAGSVNPARALDPGLVFKANFGHYIQFLCAVPGVDSESVRRATGVACSTKKAWCSDLNTASVTVSNLVGSRRVIRQVTNVGSQEETYKLSVRQPLGVNVTVLPKSFNISGNASKNLRILFEPTEVTNAYSFGEIIMEGSRNHVGT